MTSYTHTIAKYFRDMQNVAIISNLQGYSKFYKYFYFKQVLL